MVAIKNRGGSKSKPSSRARSRWISLFWTLLIVVCVSFLGGLIVGIKAHRDGVEVARFVDQYVTQEIGDGSAMLVFRCGESERLAAYDLLTDQVLTDKDAIEAARKDRILNFTQTELFASGTGIALASLAATYSFKSEVALAAKGKLPIQRLLLSTVLAVPSAYAGYAISDKFHLECASDKLYEYLNNGKNWRAHQYQALKQLFLSTRACVPREITLNDLLFSEPSDTQLWKAIVLGEKFDEVPERHGGPSVDEVAHILSKVTDTSRFNPQKALWGDSIFIRVQGYKGLTPADPKIDRYDFIALLKQAKFCRERLKELNQPDDLLSIIAMHAGADDSDQKFAIALNGNQWLRLAIASDNL